MNMLVKHFLRIPPILVSFCLSFGTIQADEPIRKIKDPESLLVFLENDKIEIGIFPELAGSALVLRRPGGANFLYVHPEDWLEWDSVIPDPKEVGKWTDFFGHIIWLGPQSDFWNQQDVFPELHGNAWPPDPSLVYGSCRILEQTPDKLVLEGPGSPYTGIRLTKTYQLKESGVEMEVIATNISERTLKWDIWSNTRVPTCFPFLVPVENSDHARIDTGDPELIAWSADSGYFSFDLTPGETPAKAKAYVTASKPWIAAFSGDTVFLKSFDSVDPAQVHPEQALVEIYYNKTAEKGAGFLELEAHGPYTSLKPGESMTFHETWTLLPYTGDASLTSRIKWVESQLE
jgi:hypothetical protein